MFPSETIDTPESYLFNYSGCPATFDAKTNNRGDHFYVPEVEMVIERWRELQYDTKALDLFKNRQMAIASEIMSVRHIPIDLMIPVNVSNFSMPRICTSGY
jgi:hypothetical protein